MSTEDDPSVTEWIADLRDGNTQEAARRLWERYFDRLARLAHARLRATPQGPADGEDVALSVFESFFRGASEGRFPQIAGRDDLWKLLITITTRKASNQRRRENQLKRGGGRVVVGTDLASGHDGDDALAQIAGGEPTPEFTAALVDEIRRLFAGLRDDSLRDVALRRMEGYSNHEIADLLKCSLRSVERKIELIRKAWEQECSP